MSVVLWQVSYEYLPTRPQWWKDVDGELAADLERSLSSSTSYYKYIPKSDRRLVTEFTIDLVAMTQRNESTGNTRYLRRLVVQQRPQHS